MSHSKRLDRRAGATAAVGAWLWSAPAAAASEGGLVLVPDPALLLPLLALFLLLIAPANALLFRPIFRILDERMQRIEGTRARAERLGVEADGLLQRYEESLARARAEAEQERRAQLDSARQRTAEQTASVRAAADADIEQARAEVGRGLEEARAVLRGAAAELADQAAERVLGRPLS